MDPDGIVQDIDKKPSGINGSLPIVAEYSSELKLLVGLAGPATVQVTVNVLEAMILFLSGHVNVIVSMPFTVQVPCTRGLLLWQYLSICHFKNLVENMNCSCTGLCSVFSDLDHPDNSGPIWF